MKSKNKRLYGQALLLIFLTAVFLISSLMIYLGATRFRSMLPIFQLLDGYNEGSLLAPKPDANPVWRFRAIFWGSVIYDFRIRLSPRSWTSDRYDYPGRLRWELRKGKHSFFSSGPMGIDSGYGEQRINTPCRWAVFSC